MQSCYLLPYTKCWNNAFSHLAVNPVLVISRSADDWTSHLGQLLYPLLLSWSRAHIQVPSSPGRPRTSKSELFSVVSTVIAVIDGTPGPDDWPDFVIVR